MYPKSAPDERYQTVEDFQAKDASRVKEDSPLLQWLSDQFNMGWKIHRDEDLPEIEYNLEKYGNNTVNDYFGDGEGTEEGNKHIFSSSMIAEKTRRIVSFLVKENPKPDIDPIFIEGYEYKVGQMWPQLPDWIKQGIAEHGGAEPDPQTGELIYSNPAGFKEWFGELIDGIFRSWWRQGNMSTFRYLCAKWSVLCPESYGMLRLVFDEATQEQTIVAEHIKSQNIVKDPTATTVIDRRVYFHVKPQLLADVIMDYDLQKDKLVADSEFSEQFEAFSGENEDDSDARRGIEQVLVVQAFLKDRRKIKIGFEDDFEEVAAYPTGRLMTFVPNQNTESGIFVLDDAPNAFSDFPVQQLILDPEDELHGRALVRDIIRISNLADEVMQQGIANLRAMGNAVILHTEGAFTEPENVSNEIATKIEINSMGDVEFKHPPSGISSEAQVLHSYLEGVARQITGVEEVAEGKKPTDIMSGKALQLLTSQVSQLMQLIVNHYAEFLTRLGKVWASMAPYVFEAGTRILYGDIDGKREWRELPFGLDEFMNSCEVYIDAETIMPKDELSKKNLLLSLAEVQASDGGPLVPAEYLLDGLDVENAEAIKRAINERNLLMQQMQQMQQQLEQATQAAQQSGQQVQQLSEENQKLNETLLTKQVDGQLRLIDTQMKNEGMNLRQQMDGEYDLEKERIKSGTSIVKSAMDKGNQKGNQVGNQ
ncbi:MAG: hypothetical protein GY833_16400 [Aestuariibacter sp.]|nr:hypothetical protein [Aestuariibacter sp.]